MENSEQNPHNGRAMLRNNLNQLWCYMSPQGSIRLHNSNEWRGISCHYLRNEININNSRVFNEPQSIWIYRETGDEGQKIIKHLI